VFENEGANEKNIESYLKQEQVTGGWRQFYNITDWRKLNEKFWAYVSLI
jgi:hypothetical protein